MGLAIIGAEERLKEKNGCKIVVCGESGVGKTSMLLRFSDDIFN